MRGCKSKISVLVERHFGGEKPRISTLSDDAQDSRRHDLRVRSQRHPSGRAGDEKRHPVLDVCITSQLTWTGYPLAYTVRVGYFETTGIVKTGLYI